LHDLSPSPELLHYILGALTPNGILQLQNSLSVQDFRSPISTALLHTVYDIRATAVSQTLWGGTRNEITELSQTAPPIFGWAAITLDVDPHSSFFIFLVYQHKAAGLKIKLSKIKVVATAPYSVGDHANVEGDGILDQGHSSPHFSARLLMWPNGWMDHDATWNGGRRRPRRHCDRWGPCSSPPRGTPPTFGSCLLGPSSWMDQDATHSVRNVSAAITL